MIEAIAARDVLVKRGLGKGPIAGIVVGVCVAVFLILLCSYPLAIRRIKNRRKEQHAVAAPDLETGEVPQPGGPPTVDDGRRRLSSQDSFKPAEEITRGGIEGGSVKDFAWTPTDGLAYTQSQPQASHAYAAPIPTSVPSAQPAYGDSQYQTAPFPDYSGEFMPQSIGDHHNGVLNGSSADYYSPSIPSEAFGMITTPDEPAEPPESLSRGSSLRQSVRQLFRRRSTREQSFSLPNSPTIEEGYEIAPGQVGTQSQDVSLNRITTAERTDSPVEITAAAAMPPPPAPQALRSPIQMAARAAPAPAGETVQTPPPQPQSPPTQSPFKMAPSPPLHPAPGTVNPMDIMPATTESEVWHRTEQQLYMSYNQSSPPMPQTQSPGREESEEALSPFSLPQSTTQPTPIVQSPTPTQRDSFKVEPADDDVPMTDIPSHNHLSPMPDYNARHSSYNSDSSTPLPGPASSNPSTQNTPATQLDSPSPKSEGTSDYRHSASPNNILNSLSPRTGSYPCDEPGCSQVFDQPHKLKYVALPKR